ncbi:translation initiation factor IF-2 N-terminal domain-containing protein, partial [Lactobacillus crispatus]
LDDKQVSKLVDSFKSANTTKPSTEKDSKNSSRKEKTKIKVSVGAIRRRDNRNDHDNRHSNNKRRNNKIKKQQNDRRAERNKPQAEAKPAARDLLNKFKKKQRAEASELNAQTEASRRKWHQEQNPQRSKVKKVENTRKPKEEKLEGAAAVKARVQASQKPVGPKIIKPSPARNKAKRPTVKKVEPIAPVVPAPQKEEAKPTRKKDFTRKKREVPDYERERSEHSDKARRRRNKKNKRINQSKEVKKQPTQRKERPLPETLVYEEGMNAQDLGKLLHREPAEIVKKLFMLGVMTNQNQSLDKDTIELLAAEYGIEAQEK